MRIIKCKDHTGRFVELPLEKFSFRPSVYALIVKDGKVVLLSNKSNSKLWFPGGGVELGETLEEALKREVKEETGLEVKPEKLVWSTENFFYYGPADKGYQAYLFFYLCRPITEKLISDELVDDIESTKPRWNLITEVRKEMLADLNDELHPILANLQ